MKSGTFKVNEEVEIFNRKGKKVGFLPLSDQIIRLEYFSSK